MPTELESLRGDVDLLIKAVDKLVTIIGDSTVHPTIENPPAVLENGRFPLIYSDYQLHLAADDLYTKLDALSGDGELPELTAEEKAWLLGQLGLSGNVPAPAPSVEVTPGDVVAQLEALGIYAEKNKLGIGIRPLAHSPSGLRIGGEAHASINGNSNSKGTDGQNPDEEHDNNFVICDNDGGMRLIPYRIFEKRNTLNRWSGIVAIDSEGNFCGSHEWGTAGDGGQSWYIATDHPQSRVILATYKIGWTVQVRESVVGYGKLDVQKL